MAFTPNNSIHAGTRNITFAKYMQVQHRKLNKSSIFLINVIKLKNHICNCWHEHHSQYSVSCLTVDQLDCALILRVEHIT